MTENKAPSEPLEQAAHPAPPDAPSTPSTATAAAAAPEQAGAPAVTPPALTVVGIGASAGGLEPLTALLRRLTTIGMALVIVQHLAPGHGSALPEILTRGTTLSVVTAQEGAALEPGTIYVAPPGADLTLREGTLHLQPSAEEIPRHSIDTFLRSLAADRGSAAIGVVLSGAGSDGTLGMKAIREEGGITFAQEPSTAAHPSMPQSVLDAGLADYCLSPEEIGDELMRLSAHPLVARRRAQRTYGPEVLEKIFDRLRRSFGVDFTSYKLATIERRLERRMALLKVERAEDYVARLDENPAEISVLYADLLIGVTAFFRDREPFEALRTVVFPRLFDARSTDVPIRVWVPGCAGGEEAYSLAICLLEYLDGRPAGYKVQVFGTDLDEAALARARQGVYPPGIDLDVSPARLQRFFTRQENGYRVSQQLRDMVLFARHNLGKDPPFSRLDLISCRNVLIYMQPSLQKRVLRVFHYALNPDAFLLVGASESVGEASDMFVLADRKLKLYSKKSIASTAVFDFASEPRASGKTPAFGHAQQAAERRPTATLEQLADRKVLEKFGPPGMLIDAKLDVIQFRGQTGPYLGPSAGVATLNVLKLVRPELLVELRMAIQKAASDGVPVATPPVTLWGAGGDAAVVLEVLPLQGSAPQEKCMLVLFRDVAGGPTPEQEARARAESSAREPTVQALERELLVTKEYLQTTVRDLEATNEELQSANEELQSANEELQSTNEELETSKEELQSANEELATVNEELQNRMSQLGSSNDDLCNVLAVAAVPMLIVGMDLRIRRISAAAERLLHLGPQDIGRRVGTLEATLNVPQLEKTISDTIESLQEGARRVRSPDGQWYTLRSIPYRTAEHTIRGAVVELVRAPPPRPAAEPSEIHEIVGSVLSTLPHALVLLDEHLRLVWANKAFFDTFFVGAEVLGHALDEVWPGRATNAALWEALEQAAAGGTSFEGMSVEHPFGRKANGWMKFSARCLPREGDRPILTLVVMEDLP